VLFRLEPPYALGCTCYLTEKVVKRVNCLSQLIIRFLVSCIRNLLLIGGGNVYGSRPSVTCSSMTPFVQLPGAVVDCRIKRRDQKVFVLVSMGFVRCATCEFLLNLSAGAIVTCDIACRPAVPAPLVVMFGGGGRYKAPLKKSWHV